MATPLEFTFRLVPLVLKLLEARGVSEQKRTELLSTLPEGAATAAEITAPVETVNGFLEAAERAARVPSIGLALATAVPRGTYASLEFIARLSCTLEEAMISVGRFYRLLNKGADIVYVERGELAGVEVRVHGRPNGWGRQLNEYTVALFHRIIRELAPSWAPVNVWFPHAEPAVEVQLALAEYFGVTPHYEAKTLGLDGPGELVDQPLPTADAELQRLLRTQASEALERETPLAALAEQVREEVRQRLGEQDVAIGAVAAALGLSVRTLQRRLRDEGLSYQDVLDSVRAQVAKQWLSNKRRNVSELAGRLGYSEPSAFDRAFRRWTGQSPTQWRSVTAA